MVVFVSQLCWSQFVNTRLCQVFRVSLRYRKNLWNRELFGKWRHNWLAKGNAHRANNGFDYGAATRQHENYLGLMLPCLWWTVHVFGTELFRNLAIWLAERRDYHLFIYKVYWYHSSMSVPIFTSFGIENSSQYSGRPRTFFALICLFIFFILWPPVFQHGASLVHMIGHTG